MKTKHYVTVFLPLALAVLLVHISLSAANLMPVNLRMTILSDVVLLFILIMGTPIVLSGLKKGKSAFVGSFMVLTTIQMLSVLSVLAAFVYMKTPNLRAVCLQMICVFVALLIIQSIVLIKIVNGADSNKIDE